MNTFILLAMLCQPVAGDPPIERRPSTAIEGLIDINLNLSLINAKFDSLAEQWKRTNDILDRRVQDFTATVNTRAGEVISIKDYGVIFASVVGGLLAGWGMNRKGDGK